MRDVSPDIDTSDGPAHDDARGYQPTRTVTELLVDAFERNAAQPAVTDVHGTITFRALDTASRRVAHHLATNGVRPGDRVGLSLDRGTPMIVGLVGILRAGAAYVPLDPGYPPERLALMCADADLRSILVSDRSGTLAGGPAPVEVWTDIDLDTDSPSGDLPRIDPEDIAYVIFTSGSTGRPKGVEMPHRALANLIEWQLRRRTFAPGARVLQYSSVSFDVSFQEIGTTLASGGHLFMVADDVRRDPRSLLTVLDEWRIRRLFLPFVALRSLVEVAAHAAGLPATLAEVITAGEQLRVDDTLREVFARNPDATLDNQYGPSETHVITAHLLDGDPCDWPDLPPIGQAIDACEVVLLDDDMQAVADGEVGHLHLGGRNLAHGYFRRPDLTDERFVAHPSRPGAALYRSGDLGRVDEAGDIHFLGRVDHQVKIRGHRIEPGEINTVGSRLPGVTQCLTHAFEKPNGVSYLVTYFTSDGVVDPSDLRAHLREHLPEYMVPAFVVELDAIRYGPSGKVDIAGLPDPRATSLLEAPTYNTETERRLAAIWSDVLAFPNLPRDANFFDLGGDSLAAVTLFLRISDEFGHDMPLVSVTQAPTIAELAERIDRHGDEAGRYRSLQLLQDGPDDVPPLFLVHGGGGNILIFSELAQRLAPHQRVYGLQWSGWDGYRGEGTVDDMAEAYLREILDRQPEGPYRLGGHCIGGLIAIELAQMLVRRGADVDGPLIVSDAPNLAADSYHRDDPERAADGGAEFESMVERLLSMVPEQLRVDGWRGLTRSTAGPPAPKDHGLIRNLVRRAGLVEMIRSAKQRVQDARIAASVALGRPVPIDLRERYCTETLKRAARGHRPTPWDGDVVYFRTSTFEGREMALDGWWRDSYLGFGELCRGSFDAHVVGGRHNDPLRLEYSAEVVRAAFADTT